jgi:hypothetical protein
MTLLPVSRGLPPLIPLRDARTPVAHRVRHRDATQCIRPTVESRRHRGARRVHHECRLASRNRFASLPVRWNAARCKGGSKEMTNGFATPIRRRPSASRPAPGEEVGAGLALTTFTRWTGRAMNRSTAEIRRRASLSSTLLTLLLTRRSFDPEPSADTRAST